MSPAPTTPDAPCPKCGAPMRTRQGARGAFLGCSAFPNCTGTRSIREAGPGPGAPEATPKRTQPELLPEALRGGEAVTFSFSCPSCGRRTVVRGQAEMK